MGIENIVTSEEGEENPKYDKEDYASYETSAWVRVILPDEKVDELEMDGVDMLEAFDVHGMMLRWDMRVAVPDGMEHEAQKEALKKTEGMVAKIAARTELEVMNYKTEDYEVTRV